MSRTAYSSVGARRVSPRRSRSLQIPTAALARDRLMPPARARSVAPHVQLPEWTLARARDSGPLEVLPWHRSRKKAHARDALLAPVSAPSNQKEPLVIEVGRVTAAPERR